MATSAASARRYAEAVFDLAVETDTLDSWSADLRTLADFVSERDVAGILGSNRVPPAEKLRLLDAGVRPYISPLAMNLVQLLNQRGKLGIAREVQGAFQETLDERRGIAHAVVTTAVPLSDVDRGAVATKLSALTGKTVDVTSVVDPAIIGGLIARIGDQLIDGSARTRLVALKRRLEGAAR